MMSVMQDLYHSEINFAVSTFWDGGFDVKLGDPMNGLRAEATVQRWGEVEPWLIAAAIEHFPDSLFARMYRDGAHAYLTEDLVSAETKAMILNGRLKFKGRPNPLSKEKRG